MGQLWKKVVEFAGKEIVLTIALVLAVCSSFVILPDSQYVEYIDFRTLGLLFCLMAVMAGLQKIGVFTKIARKLLGLVHSVRMLVLILMLLCFGFSMLITNDVALITFVPFTFTVLKLIGGDAVKRLAVPVVVMQTIAANLGSMLTPIGNPQNLYLYGKAGLGVGAFVALMLPYTLVSLVLLVGWCLCIKGGGQPVNIADGVLTDRGTASGVTAVDDTKDRGTGEAVSASKKSIRPALPVYLILFGVSLLTVAHIVPWGVTVLLVILVLLVLDREVLKRVDYALLMTFVGFFVFIGNMGRIPAFNTFLQNIIVGNEVLTAALSSQVISNVPAALLLSGFTQDYEALIIGTNLGGLGTLIASMASLISFKYMGQEDKQQKGRYMVFFTVANLLFLAVLMGFHWYFM